MTNSPRNIEALVLEGINMPSSPRKAFGYFEILEDEVIGYTRPDGPTGEARESPPTYWDVDKLLEAVGKHASFYLPSDFIPARGRPSVPFGDLGRAMIPLVRQYGNYREPMKKLLGAPSDMTNKNADDLSRICINDYLQNGLPQLLTDAMDLAVKANDYLKNGPKEEPAPENGGYYSNILNSFGRLFMFKSTDAAAPRKIDGLSLYGIRSEYGGSPAMRFEVDRSRQEVTIYAKTDDLTREERLSDPIPCWDADRLLRNVERYSGTLKGSQAEKAGVFHLDSRDVGRLLVDRAGDCRESLRKYAGAPSDAPADLAGYLAEAAVDDYLRNGLPWLSKLAEDRLTAANDFLQEKGSLQDQLRNIPELVEASDYLRKAAL